MADSDGSSSISCFESESDDSSPESTGRSQGIKRQKSGRKDRISALPDSVIQHILSFLPSTKQAVQTGILSKRWRNQWSRVPVLAFDSFGTSDENFSRFMDRTLMLHNCSKIEKFKIKYSSPLRSDPQIVSAIRFATMRDAEELILYLCPLDGGKACNLPEFLFDNDSLVKLELFKCQFSSKLSAKWSRLRELRLGCSYVHPLRFENILSGCCLLELLELTDWMWYPKARVASKSLKRLSFVDFRTNVKGGELIISCPNLEELCMKTSSHSKLHSTRMPCKTINDALSSSPFLHTLELSDLVCSGQLVIASKSLKKLILGRIYDLSDLDISCPCLEESGLYEFIPFLLPSKGPFAFTCVAMKNLRQLQHAKFLDLGCWLIQQILEAEGSSSLSLNCKCLTLDGINFGRYLPGIVSAIRCSPLLEKLDIKFPLYQFQNTGASLGLNDCKKKNGCRSDGLVFNCSVSNLRTVKIIGLSECHGNCKCIIKFVQFLLNNGRVLEKIVIMLGPCGKRFLFDVSKKLLSLPRYFYPYTTIELCSCPDV